MAKLGLDIQVGVTTTDKAALDDFKGKVCSLKWSLLQFGEALFTVFRILMSRVHCQAPRQWRLLVNVSFTMIMEGSTTSGDSTAEF